jgi:hypothetical protein
MRAAITGSAARKSRLVATIAIETPRRGNHNVAHTAAVLSRINPAGGTRNP